MKKMRKLIPAFAMLMVSAIMLSTASFAWFSANVTAKATGMNIQAQTSGGLAIATWTVPGTPGAKGEDAVEPLDENYKSSVAFGWSFGGSSLKPASHGGTTKWYTGVSDSVDSATVNGSGYTVLADFAAQEGYYNMTKWSFKTLRDGYNADVKLTGITVTGVNDAATVNIDLAKSLRVAIKNVGTGEWYYFAPNQVAGTTLYYVADASNGTRTAYGSTGNETITIGTPSVTLMEDVTSTTAQTIEVYIYFEGEDANCKTANAVNLDTITVDLSFTAVNETPITP